jgi:predicted CXXCH cytochrome family protein
MSKSRSTHSKPPLPELPPRSLKPFAIVAGVLVFLIVGGLIFGDWWSTMPDDVTSSYVGRQSCLQCHTKQSQDWSGSHHDLAMDLATDETVLADFDNAQITHHDVESTMFRQDEKFMVRTEGPDGKMADFQVKYVFGVTPLQQYMVEFDRTEAMPASEVARLQVLRLCWDTLKKKWFYLAPPDVEEKLEPDDALHWTSVTMCWNTSCADCHSTNLQKNFDVRTARYHTTFSEIDVSCESCHGPGSVHVELAKSKSLFWDRKRGYGLTRLKGDKARPQIDMCAGCHSRRQRSVHPGFRPGDNFYDHHGNSLLTSLLYHADGQIQDEVYVHGSFLQSKMYEKGVRCTDCHDPHTARLKHQGNQVCTSCHQHSAGKYDTPAHHRHNDGSTGAQCVECHMPATTYMEVDPRRDHSLRVPRPDLSVTLGTPNACSACHLEQSGLSETRREELGEYAKWRTAAETDDEVKQAILRVDEWCRDRFVEWYGEKKDVKTHFANALSKARVGDPTSVELLKQIARDLRASGIVRATCLLELGQFGAEHANAVAIKLLHDSDPQVRATAVEVLQGLPPEKMSELLAPLLSDPIRLVRTETARVLVRLPPAALRGSEREALRKALIELEAGLMVNNDRAGSHMMVGVLRADQSDPAGAQRAYETAMRIEPSIVGPRSNLAELLDRQADAMQRQAMQFAQAGNPAGRDLILKSAEMRQRVTKLRTQELALLRRDVGLVPDNGPIHYRYGLLLYLLGDEARAVGELEEACRLTPNSPDFALALGLLYQKHKRFADAISRMERVVELRPDDASARQLIAELTRQLFDSGRGEP